MARKWVFFMRNSFQKFSFILFFVLGYYFQTAAQSGIDSLFPIRGFAIAAPSSPVLDSFTNFIDQELAPRKVNVLVLRVDYHYRYTSHPELVDSPALSKEEAKKIVNACKRNNIRII